jgi:hypothetical protein
MADPSGYRQPQTTDLRPQQGVAAVIQPPQQHYQAFKSEYTSNLVYVPGMSNAVTYALSHPISGIAVAAAAHGCAAVTNRAPFNLRDMALCKILCPQVQSLYSSKELRFVTQKVGDLDLLSKAATGKFAASSPPGTYGRDFPMMSRPGQGPACTSQQAKIYCQVQVQLQHLQVPTCHFSYIHVDLLDSLHASKGLTHLFTIIDRTFHSPEALPIATTQQLTVRMLCFRGWLADSASRRSSHQIAAPSSPPPRGPPCATCLTSSMPRQQLTTRSPTVWWNAFLAASKTRSMSAAPKQTGQTSCPGSDWPLLGGQSRRQHTHSGGVRLTTHFSWSIF